MTPQPPQICSGNNQPWWLDGNWKVDTTKPQATGCL